MHLVVTSLLCSLLAARLRSPLARAKLLHTNTSITELTFSTILARSLHLLGAGERARIFFL